MNQAKSILSVFKNHWKKVLIAIVMLAIAGFVARKTVLKPPIQYTTAIVETGSLSKTLEVSGKIEADQKAILKFLTIGKLGWVGVKQGDKVSKWQAIASLDKNILKKSLEKDLNDFMHQRQDFDQVREDNLVSTDNLDDYSFTNTIERLILQEQFTLNNTVLDVEIQTLTNKLATLFSPIEGIVTDIDTPVAGVNVSLTDAFTIVDPATLYFEVEIDETDIGEVSLGQKAEIFLEAFPDEPIQSEIIWIDFSASTNDSGGTVFLAKLSLPPNQEAKLRLGMTGDVTIILEEKSEVLTVSLDAIEELEGKTIVKVQTDGQIIEQEVTLGIETDDDIEILSGLSEGDIVITGEKQTK